MMAESQPSRFTVTAVPKKHVNQTANASTDQSSVPNGKARPSIHQNVFDSAPSGISLLDPVKLSLFQHDQPGQSLHSSGFTIHHNEPDRPGKAKKANLGTFFGVFLPCCQNIVGVIYFVRFPWLIGCGGILSTGLCVFLCNLISITTAISMSAIATNGVVTAGGTYFMISRSLGPVFGGTVGLLFFCGTSISVAMYYIGTIEVLLKNVAPTMQIFDGDDGDDEDDRFVNDCRVYGPALLLIMSTVVYVGVKCVSRFALFAIIFLVAAIMSVLAGLVAHAIGYGDPVHVCKLGDRLVPYKLVHPKDKWECHKKISGPLYKAYCPNGTCEDYFSENEAKLIDGIPGFHLDFFYDTFWAHYSEKGDIPGTNVKADPKKDIVADITMDWFIIIGIYFPSITGVESGSNYSGDLRDAQKAIPRGTLTAVAVTSTLYLSSVVLMGSSVDGALLRDKWAHSLSNHGELMLSLMAWPSKWCVLIGALACTIGAGMQALAGGPRLLQAISEDEILPCLNFFSVKSRGEPVRCLLVTFIIALSGIVSGMLDYVAPIVAMFFLMCYGFINFAVTLQSLVDSPHWRPRFKYFHWTITLFGSTLCVVTMFICGWQYAIGACLLGIILFKYIEYKGEEKEWGDGFTGLSMSAAIYSLSRLQKNYTHTKNWRPQVLVLLKMQNKVTKEIELTPQDRKLVMLSSMLKGGKGLTVYGSVIQGRLEDCLEDLDDIEWTMHECLENLGVKGFVEVVINPSISDGTACMIQSAGLGVLRPNTIIIGWPEEWFNKRKTDSYHMFVDIMCHIGYSKKAAIILKCSGVEFPNANDRLEGTIDIWWVLNDGGMLLLLALLLRRDKTWSKCTLRLFSVAEENDNTVQIKKDLQTYLYQLRLDAKVEVVEMSEYDMSTYAYERTLKMEERSRMLNAMSQRKKSIVALAAPKLELDLDAQIVLQKARSHSDHSGKPKRDSQCAPRLGVDMLMSEQNLRHMSTSLSLNAVMREKSSNANIVIVNLPTVPETSKGHANYMTFLETLTEGLSRVLLVCGTGREVITVYN